MKKLTTRQNLLWNTAGCLIYQACQWLTTILVVTLSSSYGNSGILAFAMATGNIYTGLATYNMRTFQVSDVNGQFSSSNYVGFRIVTVLGASFLCACYSIIVSPSSSTAVAVLAFLLFKADESFVNVLYGVNQVGSRMDYIGISQAIRGPLCLVAFCFGIVSVDNISLAFLLMFLSCLLVTLVYDIPHSKRLSDVSPRASRETCAQLFKACAPAVAAIVLYGAVATLARQFFGIRFGEEALGIYAAVATPCALVQVMANYLYSPFLVPIAEMWNARSLSALQKELFKVAFAMLSVISICLLASSLMGPRVIELIYGESISAYSWLITPAMAAASLMAVAYFLTDLSILLRRFGIAVAINALALVVCATSMNLLYGLFYMNGVNIVIILSFAAGVSLGFVGIVRSVKREIARLKIDENQSTCSKAL